MIHPMMMMMSMAGEQSDHACHVFSQCCIATCRCSTHDLNTVVIYYRRDEGLVLRLPLSRSLGQNTQQFTAKQIAVLRRRYPASLSADRRLPAAAPIRCTRVFPASLLLAVSRAQVQVQVCKCPPNLVFSPLSSSSSVHTAHCTLSDSTPVALPPPFLLHDAAQIASHLQPSRAPPPSSVPWSRQALPLSRDSYHIVPLSHLHTAHCTLRRRLPVSP